MDCRQFQNKWPEVLDGLLSPDEKNEWEAHRRFCASCRREIESFQTLEHELRGIPPANPLPPVFWQRQTEAIMKKIDSAPHPLRRFFDSLFRPRTVWVAAALVLLAFLGYRSLLKGPPTTPGIREEIASKISIERDSLEMGLSNSEETWDLDLTETQIDRYYADLAQRYLPAWEDDSEETDWLEDLNEQDLNRAIQYFEKNTRGRTL